jgi:predicted glycogen debranching enzyme
MITLDRSVCSNYGSASSREWLDTNGIGGYASGTVSGAATRRYHSLLTAATQPPLGRIRTISKFEETLVIDSKRFDFSTNQYSGAVSPDGYKYITEFRLDPFPIWRYEVGDVVLERKIFMAHGRNATICRWSAVGGAGNVMLELRPLMSFVDHHALQHENEEFEKSFEISDSHVLIQPYDGRTGVYIAHNAKRVAKSGYWYRDFEYAIEKERGFDFLEDLFQPCVLLFDLTKAADIVIATEKVSASDAAKLEQAEIKRRRKLVSVLPVSDELTSQLALAANHFVVSRGDGNTIIAGYPWFSDWGRDTFISLAGLTLSTGRPKAARAVLLEFSKYISEGMLPNRFPDEGQTADYNTVDATLWYFEAVRAYVEVTGDNAFVRRNLYSKLSEIITWHLRGTRFNIAVDTDGLLSAGGPGLQLTWMDAKVGDIVMTPRTGKPVEIQALWYNALRVMADLAVKFGHKEDERRFKAMADLAKLSFNALFWNEQEQCLFDVVDDGNKDGSIRPNQIFAVSLKYSMLDETRARAVVDKVEDDLLTPVGLRSLSPRDEKYIPYYVGTPFERDSAYHQGTVWAWLMGPFIAAYRRVYPDRMDKIEAISAGFRDHIQEACVGQISEIFDAEWPHSPRGCPAQAWSVGELLRVRMAD